MENIIGKIFLLEIIPLHSMQAKKCNNFHILFLQRFFFHILRFKDQHLVILCFSILPDHWYRFRIDDSSLEFESINTMS